MTSGPIPAMLHKGDFAVHRIAIIARGLVARGLVPGRILGTIAIPCVLALMLAGLACPRAKGDLGVVLNESLNTSVDRITGTGHSAVYFSRICANSPVKLRLCGPDERGSVMSNYTNIGEDQSFEWNVVPLNIYLYGVEDLRDRPIFGSFKVKHVLEERYRKNYLSALCAGDPCMNSSKSEWRETVAATFVRSIYVFIVETTEEQDRKFIAEFNDSLNENHFNGVTRNCADFTRRVINTYFPSATRPDYLNDFGMTSPKAIARSFTHYARRHPESNLRVLHFAQMPGTIKRSSEVRSGTEQLYHSKKFLIPMVLFADYALPPVAASYLLTGRFNPVHEFERHPAVEEVSARNKQSGTASPEERTRVVGTSREWKEYRKAFDSIVVEDIQKEAIDDRWDLKRFFKHFDEVGTPFVDEHGLLWMETSENGRSTKVGLSASNILTDDSDPQLAHKLLLTRVDRVLKSPKHSRETMSEFVQDWTTLRHASEKHALILARNASSEKKLKGAPQPEGGID
jgi:hypothetical protein